MTQSPTVGPRVFPLAPLPTTDAILLNLANADLTPVAYEASESHARLAGYFTRGDGAAARHFGHAFLSLDRDSAGAWKVAAMTPAFPGPPVREPITAEKVVAQLDDAGIRRAAVLSLAYWYGNPSARPDEHEYDKVRAENDGVAREVAQFADRFGGFCSFNRRGLGHPCAAMAVTGLPLIHRKS